MKKPYQYRPVPLSLSREPRWLQGCAIGNHDEVVGSADFPPGSSASYGPFLYAKGKLADLRVPPPYINGVANGINAHNVIVGYVSKPADRGSDTQRAFLLDRGRFTVIDTPSGASSEAHAINDNGWVVGEAGVRGFVYHDGKMTDLGCLSDEYGTVAYAINRRNQIVGSSGRQPFLWQDGKMSALPGLKQAKGEGLAFGISDAGEIVGVVDSRAFLWKEGKVTWLGRLALFGSAYAQKINRYGQIVGSAENGKGDGNWGIKKSAFLYDGGKMYDLNKLLVKSDHQYELVSAWDINDRGNIVCRYALDGGCLGTVLLVPV